MGCVSTKNKYGADAQPHADDQTNRLVLGPTGEQHPESAEYEHGAGKHEYVSFCGWIHETNVP